MPIKSRFFLLVLFPILTFSMLPALHARPTDEDALRYKTAHLLVFGVLPDSLPDNLPEGDLKSAVQHCASTLQKAQSGEQSAVKERAWMDTMGTASDPSIQIDALSYHEYVGKLSTYLEQHPAAYEQVIRRAYPYVIYRDVYTEEMEYWRNFPVMGYATLVGCLEDWARRNQPGLMVTGGIPTLSVNCEFLTTLRVTPSLAGEICSLMGIPLIDPQSPYHVLAKGADKVISSGGIYFILTGSAGLRQNH